MTVVSEERRATDPGERRAWWAGLFARPATLISVSILIVFFLIAALGSFFVGDHLAISSLRRMRPPSATAWFGTDHLGRDIFARTVIGSRNSLIVGASVAGLAVTIGSLLGLYAGYFRYGERAIMRVMDGLMAIPGVLLAISLAALLGSGLVTVIIAILVPEIPRMTRLVRGVVLTLKEQPYVTAAVSIGTTTPKILFKHILPNSVGVLTVQGTYVCASAIMTESVLSFLGVGTPPDIPSWGNIMASGRQYFQIAPWIIGFPGLFLSILVLSINIFGDALRDSLDPRLKRRGGL